MKPALTHYVRNHQKYVALSSGGPWALLQKGAVEKNGYILLLFAWACSISWSSLHFRWVMTISIQAKWQAIRALWGTAVVRAFFNRERGSRPSQPLNVLLSLLRPNPNIFLRLKGSSFQAWKTRKDTDLWYWWNNNYRLVCVWSQSAFSQIIIQYDHLVHYLSLGNEQMQ